MHPFETDILAPLGQTFQKQADALLDLRQYAINKEHPGKCVSCYFKLYEQANNHSLNRLSILRKWLETNLEIVAKDEQDRFLERIPVCLEDEENLESFCARLMQEIIHNRAYECEKIALYFRFRDEAAA